MIQWLILLSNKYLLAEITNPQHSSLTASFHLLLTARSESGQPWISVQSGGRDGMCVLPVRTSDSLGDSFIVSAPARSRYSTNPFLQGGSLNPTCCKFCRESCWRSWICCICQILPCLFLFYPSCLLRESLWVVHGQIGSYSPCSVGSRLSKGLTVPTSHSCRGTRGQGNIPISSSNGCSVSSQF